MTTKEFADQYNMPEKYILRLKKLSAGLDMEGLGPDEYEEWRKASENFTFLVLRGVHLTDTTLLEGEL